MDDEQDGGEAKATSSSGPTVLEEVIEKATAKQALEKEVKGMSYPPYFKASLSDPMVHRID